MDVTYIQEFVGKKIKIFLEGGIYYQTDNLQIVSEEKAIFTDFYGVRVLISLKDIQKIVEVRR